MRKSGWRSVRNACSLRDTETGRCFVAVVNNPLERNIAEPSRHFGGRVLQPFSAIQVVDERRPVGTPDIARRDDSAEQPAQMDFLVHREKRDLVHEPPPGAMTVSGVTAIRVEPRRKKGQSRDRQAALRRRRDLGMQFSGADGGGPLPTLVGAFLFLSFLGGALDRAHMLPTPSLLAVVGFETIPW